MVDNPLAGAIPSVNVGGLFNLGINLTFWVFAGLLLAVIIWFVWWMFSFKHTVVIKQKIGRPIKHTIGQTYQHQNIEKKTLVDKAKAFFTKDKSTPLPVLDDSKKDIKEEEVVIIPYLASIYKAKFVSKKKVRYLILQFSNLKLKIPDQVYQNITQKGKKYIELTQISEHIFAPTILTDFETGKHTFIYDESWFDWVVNDIEKDHQKYMHKDWWGQYGNWVMTAGLLVIMMIIIVVTLKYSREIVEATKPLVSSLVEASKAFAEAQKTQHIG